MWGESTEEPWADEIVEPKPKYTYCIYFLAILFACYFLYLFLQNSIYNQARMRLLQNQAGTLTGNVPESTQNFFAAVRHWEKLVRD